MERPYPRRGDLLDGLLRLRLTCIVGETRRRPPWAESVYVEVCYCGLRVNVIRMTYFISLIRERKWYYA
jgi:hypothetical protein